MTGLIAKISPWFRAAAGMLPPGALACGLHIGTGLATGACALHAVSGLTGTPLPPASWVVALPLLLVVCTWQWWLARAARRGGLAAELLLLAGALLVFGLMPGWTLGWEGRLITVLVWRLLSLLLTGIARMAAGGGAAGDHARLQVLLLFLLGWASLHAYFSPQVVGPKDARWYGNLVMDFLTRMRAGDFPIFSGESIYAFNGNILTVRTAPAHVYLTALLDVLTGRSLVPLAVQHVALWLCSTGGVMLLYVSLARLRPAAKWTACLFASIYGMSPALMTPLVLHDMYMTVTALPMLVLLWHATARVVETGARRHYAWVGLACAGLWYAHPPLAFLGTVGAGFLVSMKGFAEGVSRRWLMGCGIGAALFGALVWPIFYWLSEIPPTNHFFPLPNVILPAVAIFLLGYALVGTVCGRELYPLAVLPVAWMTLVEFKPSLVPFATIFTGLFVLAAVIDRWRDVLGVRRRPEPWLLACGLAAAAAATLWFPERSLPAREFVADVVGTSLVSWGEFFRLVIGGADTQPHAVWWLLFAAGLGLAWQAPSRFARGALIVALLAVLTILPVPLFKRFIWGNTTVEFWDLMVDGVWLRFWPFSLAVLLFAVHLMLADLAERSTVRRIIVGAVVVLLPWAAWDHAKIVQSIFVRSAEETARFYRPENIILQSYSWDHLRKPAYYSSTVLDPRLEIRLWRQGPGRQLLLDPDIIARALEPHGGEHLALQATPDPNYPEWVYLAPKIVLPAGAHKLLRFDFKGKAPQGWLIVRGQDIYRDYRLPSAGMERSFGAGPLNTRTLSIENTGTRDEVLELVIKREGAGSTAPVRPEDFPAVIVTPFDGARSPVEVKSLSPLVLRVTAPEKGMLEVFRSAYPGYRVDVNGGRVPYTYSRDGLVAFEVPAGISEVLVRFRGTWQLRNSFWYGLVSWGIAGIYVLIECLRATGWWRSRRN